MPLFDQVTDIFGFYNLPVMLKLIDFHLETHSNMKYEMIFFQMTRDGLLASQERNCCYKIFLIFFNLTWTKFVENLESWIIFDFGFCFVFHHSDLLELRQDSRISFALMILKFISYNIHYHSKSFFQFLILYTIDK